jgi:hypothetical protein
MADNRLSQLNIRRRPEKVAQVTGERSHSISRTYLLIRLATRGSPLGYRKSSSRINSSASVNQTEKSPETMIGTKNTP